MYLRYSNEFKQEPKNKRKKNKTRKPKIPKENIKTRNFGFLIKKLDKPKLRKSEKSINKSKSSLAIFFKESALQFK